jgi:hypothetical protein
MVIVCASCTSLLQSEPKIMRRSKTGSLTDKKIEYSIEYPEIQGLRDAQAQRRINEFINARLADALKTAAVATEEYASSVGMQIGFQSKLVTKELLSLTFGDSRMAQDTAHPSMDIFTLNFNLRTGTRLTLTDLFRGDTPFRDVIAHETLNRLPGTADVFEDLTETELALFSADFNEFSLSESAFIVEYGSCAVQSCAGGPLSVSIPYSALVEIIDPKGPLKNASDNGLK